jgi:hypothetical protein
MARALTGVKTNSDFDAVLYEAGVEGIGSVQAPYRNINHRPAWTSGNGTGQANRVWYEASVVLAAAGTFNLDLFDFAGRDLGKGSGLDAQGLTMALTEIAYLSVRVTAAGSGGKLRLGGEGSGAAWNSGFGGSDSAVSHDIGLGGRKEWLAWTAGELLVADSTNHLLKFLGVTAEVTFDIVILGRQ